MLLREENMQMVDMTGTSVSLLPVADVGELLTRMRNIYISNSYITATFILTLSFSCHVFPPIVITTV